MEVPVPGAGVARRRPGAPISLRPAVLKPVVFTAALLPLLWLGWRGFAGDLGADPIRELELETGRWTLRMLAATLAITPLRMLTRIGALVSVRRMLGLFTFFYASIHLAMWVGVDWFFDFPAMAGEIVKHRYILVGMLTWVLLLPLAVTSTRGWVRRLGGRRWNRLHRLAYVAAVTGTIHYLWAVKKDTFWPVVYFATFAILLGVRVWTRRRAR